jgi:hypothetical protein
MRTIIEEHNKIFFWIPRQLLHDVRRRVAAVGWRQDLIVAKRRDHFVNICVNFQPGREGPLSALLNDLKRAIEHWARARTTKKLKGEGVRMAQRHMRARLKTIQRHVRARSEDEVVGVEESEYGNGDVSEDEIGNGNEAEEN